jgi:Domain of unknown function (DUF4136)
LSVSATASNVSGYRRTPEIFMLNCHRLAMTGVTLATALLLAACASGDSAVRVDKNANADFSQCHSFGWALPVGGASSSLSEQRVKSEAFSALTSKGYTIDEAHPDCRVAGAVNIHPVQQPKPGVGVGVGGGSGGTVGGIGISLPLGKHAKNTGTLRLDVMNEASKAQIWTGSLDSNFGATEISPDEARAMVKQILGEYPAKK